MDLSAFTDGQKNLVKSFYVPSNWNVTNYSSELARLQAVLDGNEPSAVKDAALVAAGVCITAVQCGPALQAYCTQGFSLRLSAVFGGKDNGDLVELLELCNPRIPVQEKRHVSELKTGDRVEVSSPYTDDVQFADVVSVRKVEYSGRLVHWMATFKAADSFKYGSFERAFTSDELVNVVAVRTYTFEC